MELDHLMAFRVSLYRKWLHDAMLPATAQNTPAKESRRPFECRENVNATTRV
jgi:hypothetical protein